MLLKGCILKNSIEGFNQKFATTLKKDFIVNGKIVIRKIDCTDLVIMRWFVDFYPNMKKIEYNGKQYGWITYKKVLEDLPILDISKQSLADRLKKLVDFKLLSSALIKEGGTFSVYCVGDNYKYLIENESPEEGGDKNLVGSVVNYNRGVYSTTIGGSSQLHTKDKSIIDSSVKDIFPPMEIENFGTETGQCPNPQEYFFEHWNVTTDDLTGREAGALSYMNFEKLNAAMEKSKSFLQTDKIARYITFYIRNYKRIIAGYYDDDKHNPSKSTSKSKNAAEPPRERYDMKAICAEDRSGGVF